MTILGLLITMVGFFASFLAVVLHSPTYVVMLFGAMTVAGVILYSLALVDFS